MQKNKQIQEFLTQSDIINGFWEEFEAKHETQKEEHPWKLKYFVALAFAEGVAMGMKNAKAEEN
tara:strand:- start:121 stop:312 length:192 start_codon:yes stop_codon:yes gene_type:complete